MVRARNHSDPTLPAPSRAASPGDHPEGRHAEASLLEAWSRDYPAGHRISEHSHARGQLLYAMSGLMRVTTRIGAWTVPPSRAFWIPARVRHEVRIRSAAAMRTLYIHPKSEFDFPSECALLDVSPLLRELILAAVREKAESRWTARIARILALLHDELHRANRRLPGIPLPKDARLARVCSALAQKPSMRRSLDEWARGAKVSARTLARLFLRETGMSFRSWRQQVVLSEAVALLDRKLPVARVAALLGYRSASAFSLMFQQALGKPPGRYLA
jgi:AraC-like DNA-binding protein